LIFPLKRYFLSKESGCVSATQNIVFPDVYDVKKKEGEKWLADLENKFQNVQLASLAWKICSVVAKGVFRRNWFLMCTC